MGTVEFVKLIIAILGGAVSGFFTSLYTFKFKMFTLERDLRDHRLEVTKKFTDHQEYLKRIDRRQTIMLETLVDLASGISDKLGIQPKSGSILMKFIQSEKDDL